MCGKTEIKWKEQKTFYYDMIHELYHATKTVG
jgi:hypothetical protein